MKLVLVDRRSVQYYFMVKGFFFFLKGFFFQVKIVETNRRERVKGTLKRDNDGNFIFYYFLIN